MSRKMRTELTITNHKANHKAKQVCLPDPVRQDGTLRIATLSWSTPERDSIGLLEEEFLSTITAINKSGPCPDIVLCSGCQLPSRVDPGKLLGPLRGWNSIISVLYEWNPWIFDDSKPERNVRELAFIRTGTQTPESVTVRSDQFVIKKGDPLSQYKPLVDELITSAGCIIFNSLPVNLVLFICGENNAFSHSGTRSIFDSKTYNSIQTYRNEVGDQKAKIQAVCNEKWILLNPAHRWYRNESFSCGFGKVHQFVKGTKDWDPVLARLSNFRYVQDSSKSHGVRGDGTVAPWAVIHCNNFDKNAGTNNLNRHMESVASVCFFGGVMAAQKGIDSQSGNIVINGKTRSWYYQCYKIPLV